MIVQNDEVRAPEQRRRRNLLQAIVAELRPKQWVKNLVCFAGLIFSGQLFVFEANLLALFGFAAFCCAASSIYIVNDILDRKKDRNNPRTSSRPIASGDLSVTVALLVMLVLAGTALVVSAMLATSCLIVVASYWVMNVLYSVRLKQTVIADVMCIALGFVLRVVYGVYAIGEMPTAWIVICMFFLALFLGFAKRKAELSNIVDSTQFRPVLGKYQVNYLDILLAMAATMAILSYGLFTVSSHANPTLIVTIVPVVYCVMRYMLKVIQEGYGESPEKLLLSDMMMWIGIIIWLVLCVVIMYWDVRLFVEPAPSVF